MLTEQPSRRHAVLTAYAELLLQEAGLIASGWKFIITDAEGKGSSSPLKVSTYGHCNHNSKEIVLNGRTEHIAYIPLAEQVQTIAHECAHALVGGGEEHNTVWQDTAFQLGVVNPKSHKKVYSNIENQGYTWYLVTGDTQSGEILLGRKRKPKYFSSTECYPTHRPELKDKCRWETAVDWEKAKYAGKSLEELLNGE